MTTVALADATATMADSTTPPETPDADASNEPTEIKDLTTASSFLEAAASAEVEEGDVENQQGDDLSSSVEKPLPNTSTATAANIGIFSGDEDDTASVFSFDSYEKQPRISLRVQNMIRRQKNSEGGDDPNSSAVPFPSVVGASMEYEHVVNVCPCRCLFFTLKETICLIMSALGCAVYLAGLIVLIMYLEGSLFNNS
mmetsp:Transcript_16295/g.28818  ORF Transcript_16295/g.28818 Transcript_16295/m.28818 type:complete len:198 (+) Transcript_16295:25-618(+)